MNDHAEMITVVTPTMEGREDLLARAMASVDAQVLTPKRHIIVIDSRHRGAWWARNQGLTQVDTPWVAWLDDDDTLYPEHLAVLFAGTLDAPPPDVVYSYPDFWDDRTNRPWRDPLATCNDQGQLVAEPIGVPFGPRQAAWLRTMGNFIPVTTLMRTSKVREVGGFPPPTPPPRGEEDYLLLLKLLDAGARFRHLGRRTWRYHVTGRNTGGGVPRTGASNR